MCEIRSRISPLDTTTFDCVQKRHCAFDTSLRTLKKSHTTLLVAIASAEY